MTRLTDEQIEAMNGHELYARIRRSSPGTVTLHIDLLDSAGNLVLTP